MNNKFKLAFLAAVALASVSSPVLAQDAATVAHGDHYAHRPLYDSVAPGYHAKPSVAPRINPADDPALTGGGSPGYNTCAGHPAC
jgi:hypothetical protein